MKDYVFVKGNIICYSGFHVVRQWVCLAPLDYQEHAIKVIDCNLILNERTQTIPYYSYVASGGVTCVEGNVATLSSPDMVLERYQEGIRNQKELSAFDVPSHLKHTYLNGLYASVISELELFITELLSNLIFGNKMYFDKFIELQSKIQKIGRIKNEDYSSHELIFKAIHEINAHNFKIVGKIYKLLFEIDFPEVSELERMIHIRHDISHRAGNKVEKKCLIPNNVTIEMLGSLFETCDAFVENMMKALHDTIAVWNNSNNG
jgi:hypothetical protein